MPNDDYFTLSTAQARCGLCDRWVDESWEEHVQGEEHRANLADRALVAARMSVYRSGLPVRASGARTEEEPGDDRPT
jgi:hypothetical protein